MNKNNYNKNKVVFTNKNEQELLAKFELKNFTDFWNIEANKFAKDMGIEVKRSHKVRGGNTILRETCMLKLDGEKYFLKRSTGKSFSAVKNELTAREILPQFDLTSSQFSAHAIDESGKQAFILMKDLSDYISLYDLHEMRKNDEKYQQIFDEFAEKLIISFKEIQQTQYFYRDWFVKHLFYNPTNKLIAVIDLERFYSVKQLPFYYFLSAVRNYKRKKEQQVLAKSLQISIEKLAKKLS
ncbi:hypothetical protein AAEX28_00770 [Lentisphaerota bacterium WC36G]|nr:hypothetical protein LJT99_03650 [Lentisphaerae bacterium WC36]